MRYITFATLDAPEQLKLGAMVGEAAVDLQEARGWAQGARALPAEPLPQSLFELLHQGPHTWDYARAIVEALKDEEPTSLKGPDRRPVGYPQSQVRLFAPLPQPRTLRDFYAFEKHVATAHANRGKEIPPAWYEIPVFYYSNPHAIFGPGEVIPHPASSQALDYELEVACVLGAAGKDIPAGEADEHIFGYMILNDWSARDVQRQEMAVGLGPAKGKDFATSIGPWIVTSDELADRATDRAGVFDLQMVARINGEERSRGNWSEIHYSFGEMIARASADVFLLPGEVIGSGTVGSGSLLELTHVQGPWLQPGDVVELEIEKLGTLRNIIGDRTDK